MGPFRDHFHWRSLATLPIGVISILLFFAGLLSRLDGRHGAAVFVFVLASLGIIIRFIHAAVVSEHSKANRFTFGIVCSLLVVGAAGYLVFVTWPDQPVTEVAVVPGPQPSPISPSLESQGEPAPGLKPAPETPRGGGAGGKKNETPKPSPVVPPGPKPEPPAPPPTLFIDCRMGTLPKTVPASGRIYALVPQPLPQENGGGGLLEYFGQPGTDWTLNKLREFVYRCEVINYASSLLIDLEMDFAYEMRRPILVPDQPKALKQGEVTLSRTWPIKIAKVDVGTNNPFMFYLHNCCQDRFVYFRAAPTARGMLDGSRVEFRVQQSENNLSQPLMPVRPEEKR